MEVSEQLKSIESDIAAVHDYLHKTDLQSEVADLKKQAGNPKLWEDPSHGEKVTKAFSQKEALLNRLTHITSEYELLSTLSNEELLELSESAEALLAEVSKVKTLLFLNGHYDQNNAILSLHAGTGGKDAQDFTEMLMRMYLRFTENQEWKTTILDQRDGEEVGLKSATILVEGHLAYGLLKSEHGVHRLVRLSPFNAGNTRETSFALVEVLPEIDSSSEVDLKDDELKIDVFRSSGAGGQSVNTTDSAVRITHIPTGITVSCQNERSQLQNKQTALKILTGKLVEIKEREHLESVSDIKGAHKEIAWGNQIRSYVLQPYTMVKDHRTNVETSQVDKVLDGDLMEFIEGYLIKQS